MIKLSVGVFPSDLACHLVRKSKVPGSVVVRIETISLGLSLYFRFPKAGKFFLRVFVGFLLILGRPTSSIFIFS